jgi:hypothetical protein
MKTVFNAILFTVVFVIVLGYAQKYQKEQRADEEAKIAKTKATMKHYLETQEHFIEFCKGGIEDEWGNPIVILGGDGTDKTVGVTLLSYGPDGKPNTRDDIRVSGGIDWLKVGRKTGKITKDMAKGFWEGLRD